MNLHSQPQRIAFWLLPEEKERARLQEIIDQLADRLSAPRFIPHLTLLTRPADDVADPASLLEHLTSRFGALQLEVCGQARSSSQFNQALVLPATTTPELDAVVSALHPLKIVPNGYAPHLSLLYAQLDPEIGRQLEQEFSSESFTARFDHCTAIDIGPGCRCQQDVEQWRTIATRRFSSGK